MSLPANCGLVLSEAVLVLVIEVIGIATNLRIDYDYAHEHDNLNWRAKPIPAQAGIHQNGCRINPDGFPPSRE